MGLLYDTLTLHYLITAKNEFSKEKSSETNLDRKKTKKLPKFQKSRSFSDFSDFSNITTQTILPNCKAKSNPAYFRSGGVLSKKYEKSQINCLLASVEGLNCILMKYKMPFISEFFSLQIENIIKLIFV
jgi:hypothetical protein